MPVTATATIGLVNSDEILEVKVTESVMSHAMDELKAKILAEMDMCFSDWAEIKIHLVHNI